MKQALDKVVVEEDNEATVHHYDAHQKLRKTDTLRYTDDVLEHQQDRYNPSTGNVAVTAKHFHDPDTTKHLHSWVTKGGVRYFDGGGHVDAKGRAQAYAKRRAKIIEQGHR